MKWSLSHHAERFRHVLFWEFPCPAWAVASCSSGPLAGGNSLKLFRKTSLHDGIGNSVYQNLFYKLPPQTVHTSYQKLLNLDIVMNVK